MTSRAEGMPEVGATASADPGVLECSAARGSVGPPSWVRALLAGVPSRHLARLADEDVSIDVHADDTLGLVSFRASHVRDLAAGEFLKLVASLYEAMADTVAELGMYPLRIWNFVPGITERREDGVLGYEHFNAARHQAMATWLGKAARERGVCAASAVDCRDGGLSVFALLACEGGTPVQNPRQTPPPAYSRLYGRQPPVFARAMIIPPAIRERCKLDAALVSGTASIVDEDSAHPLDLARQLVEIGRNLDALTAAVSDRCGEGRGHLRTMRAYVPRRADEPAVRRWVLERYPRVETLEVIAADLCRRELLVEVEATAMFLR